MTDVEKLKDKIEASGKKKCYLAKKIGVSKQGFRNLCLGKTQFRTEQVKILCEELNITDLEEKESIFFAPGVA